MRVQGISSNVLGHVLKLVHFMVPSQFYCINRLINTREHVSLFEQFEEIITLSDSERVFIRITSIYKIDMGGFVIILIVRDKLTHSHISLASFLWDIGKQCSPGCDAAERGVPSGATLFA